MLKARQAIATVAVKDLASARRFYSETLELKPTARQEEGTLSYQIGSSTPQYQTRWRPALRRKPEARLVQRSGRQHPFARQHALN